MNGRRDNELVEARAELILADEFSIKAYGRHFEIQMPGRADWHHCRAANGPVCLRRTLARTLVCHPGVRRVRPGRAEG